MVPIVVTMFLHTSTHKLDDWEHKNMRLLLAVSIKALFTK